MSGRIELLRLLADGAAALGRGTGRGAFHFARGRVEALAAARVLGHRL